MFYLLGIHRFKKVLGPHGSPATCANCGNTYSPTIVRINRWFHVNFLPLIPLGFEYWRHCPVCWYSERIKKADMGEKSGFNLLVPYAYVHKRSATYDLELKDADTNQRFRILSRATKGSYKKVVKMRGYKNIETVTLED